MNTNNCILKDLSSLITQTTIHYNEDFKWQDVELTSEFKDAYEEYLDRNNWKIEFFNAKSNDYLKKSPVYGHFRKTAA